MSSSLRAGAVLGMVLGLAGLACSSSTSSSPGLRIKVLNATGLDVRVAVDGPGFSPRTLNIVDGGDRNTYPPGAAGDVISFTVTVPTDGTISGNGACTAGPNMSPGSTGDLHGQVNLFLSSATTIDVECSGAGLPLGGWQ